MQNWLVEEVPLWMINDTTFITNIKASKTKLRNSWNIAVSSAQAASQRDHLAVSVITWSGNTKCSIVIFVWKICKSSALNWKPTLVLTWHDTAELVTLMTNPTRDTLVVNFVISVILTMTSFTSTCVRIIFGVTSVNGMEVRTTILIINIYESTFVIFTFFVKKTIVFMNSLLLSFEQRLIFKHIGQQSTLESWVKHRLVRLVS